MEGEIRVTLIATGFDRALGQVAPDTRMGIQPNGAGQKSWVPPQIVVPKPSSIVRPGQGNGQPGQSIQANQPPAARPFTGPARPMRPATQDDLEIPTFMRRQMD